MSKRREVQARSARRQAIEPPTKRRFLRREHELMTGTASQWMR